MLQICATVGNSIRLWKFRKGFGSCCHKVSFFFTKMLLNFLICSRSRSADMTFYNTTDKCITSVCTDFKIVESHTIFLNILKVFSL